MVSKGEVRFVAKLTAVYAANFMRLFTASEMLHLLGIIVFHLIWLRGPERRMLAF